MHRGFSPGASDCARMNFGNSPTRPSDGAEARGEAARAAREAELAREVAGLLRGVLSEDQAEELVTGALPAGTVDARLNTALEKMRRDAAGLRASAGEATGLPTLSVMIAGVESRLNQAAIAELLEAEQRAPAIALPRARGNEPGGWRAVTESRWVRRSLAAAAVVLIAGGGLIVVQGVRSAWPKTGAHTDGVLAHGTTRGGARGAPATVTPGPAPEDRAIAVASGEPDDLDAGKPAAEPAAKSALASAEVDQVDTPPELTPERLTQLASEGRLVIRVRTLDAEALVHRLDHFEARTLARGAGDLEPLSVQSLPTAYAGLATPRTVIDGGRAIDPAQPVQTPAVASESGASLVGPVRDLSPESGAGLKIAPRPVVSAVYVAHVPTRDGDVASVRMFAERALASAGPARSAWGFQTGVTVEVLDQPLDGGEHDAASLHSADDVLWWSGASVQWVKKLRVPIVVETVRVE